MNTPEERLWAAKWCMMMLDAIDGPMTLPETEPDMFGETTTPHMTEEQLVERDARATVRDDIANLSPTFVQACDAVGYDPEYVRQKFAAGMIQRQSVLNLFVRVRGED